MLFIKNNELQVTGTIRLLPPLAKYLFIEQKKLLFIESSNMFRIDLTQNTNDRIQVKSSKDINGQKIISLVQIEDSTLLIYCEDLSLKSFKILENGKSQNWTILGYLCPYCLTVCSSRIALFKEHMDVHLGPIQCTSCQVIDKLFKKNI